MNSCILPQAGWLHSLSPSYPSVIHSQSFWYDCQGQLIQGALRPIILLGPQKNVLIAFTIQGKKWIFRSKKFFFSTEFPFLPRVIKKPFRVLFCWGRVPQKLRTRGRPQMSQWLPQHKEATSKGPEKHSHISFLSRYPCTILFVYIFCCINSAGLISTPPYS